MGRTPELPITQRELARLAGLSESNVNRFLSGTRLLTRFSSQRLGYAIGTRWQDVIGATPAELKRLIETACAAGTIAAVPYKAKAEGRK